VHSFYIPLTSDISVFSAQLLYSTDITLSCIPGATTNRFLNENWREAFKTYKYLPEEAFGILFKDLTNNVIKHFPFKDLFPE
jgi:hypothetical protein